MFQSVGRESLEPGHKNSKDLFVLNTSREWVVGYEVVHRNKRGGRFVGVGPRDGPMTGRIGVVIGRWARWSEF